MIAFVRDNFWYIVTITWLVFFISLFFRSKKVEKKVPTYEEKVREWCVKFAPILGDMSVEMFATTMKLPEQDWTDEIENSMEVKLSMMSKAILCRQLTTYYDEFTRYRSELTEAEFYRRFNITPDTMWSNDLHERLTIALDAEIRDLRDTALARMMSLWSELSEEMCNALYPQNTDLDLELQLMNSNLPLYVRLMTTSFDSGCNYSYGRMLQTLNIRESQECNNSVDMKIAQFYERN
jgi:hypothetical protein